MNTPQSSARPAREMMAVPLSSSMAGVGVCRAQVPAAPAALLVYCAMLLAVRDAVSVDQMEVAEENTKP